MTIWQSVLEALESISANKLRSGLTILGIVIGVASVIAMLAVGNGAQQTITDSISGVGANLLFVFKGNFTEDVRNPKPLTMKDAYALADIALAPSVFAVAPVLNGTFAVNYQGKERQVQVSGVTPEFQTVRKAALLEGDFINNEQILAQASVAVIGTDVADYFFGRRDGLIGETIRIAGQPFRVIGVLASKGGSSFGSQDNVVDIPISTARQRLIHRQRDIIDRIYIEAVSADEIDSAVQEVEMVLRNRHGILIGANDFTIFSQKEILAMTNTVTGILTTFLGGVAAISLVVGGIGIMNIMLVSVTERTREIGLRKALGARNRDILLQFLTESSLLSLIGGLIGIALGYLIGIIVGWVATLNGTAFAPQVRLDAILLATLFSTAVGLFFGIYPARRAALLEPVEALRHD